jgi:hypothetical protein
MKKQILILTKQEDAWVKFDMEINQDFSKTLRYFFVCYADFECSNIPALEMKSEKTRIFTKQIPNSFMVFCPDLMVLEDDRKLRMDTYLKKFQSDDPYKVLEEFIRALDIIRKNCIFRLQSHPRVPKLTKEEQEKYEAAKVCEKCKNSFHALNRPKVRHHCHVTGKYIGAWCRRCNYLEGKKKFKLVVFFHNLRGYDSHMILRYGLMEIVKLHGKDGNIHQFIIGKSAEKLSSFQFGNFIFRDSLLHLECSLERAVDNLTKSNHSFPICEKVGLHPILRQEWIYPYKWVDSIKRFDHSQLPGIEFFYNDLTQEPCSPEDYQHAQNVWKTLKCKTFGDYHHYYLMADVVLLAEVFEEYRAKGLSNWQLDPAQFVTAPSYTYKAFLKYIDRPIQVMWYLGMYHFFRDALPGGYCSVGEMVFANVYKKEDECIVGFDMNSLYSKAMLYPMPLAGFEWSQEKMGRKYFETIRITGRSRKQGIGWKWILNVPRTSMIVSQHIPCFPRESMAS